MQTINNKEEKNIEIEEEKTEIDITESIEEEIDTTIVSTSVDESSDEQQSREYDNNDNSIADEEQEKQIPAVLMEHVTKKYLSQIENNEPAALNDVSITIQQGEFVFLVGHSGSGKSSLIHSLIRDVIPDSGKLEVGGVDLITLSDSRVPYLRRNIGCVFQDFKLLPNKTAYENVAFAMECIGASRVDIKKQVPEVFKLVGIEDKMDKLPDELSGGEQQRVSIARAIINQPPLLICDEPTGNLDPATADGIMELLLAINEHTATTVLIATHDQEIVNKNHKRVIRLSKGKVISDEENGEYIAKD